ncbi:hypothetical protein BC834DRAFT_813350, partial [Gloeopeniophorella convolvens]
SLISTIHDLLSTLSTHPSTAEATHDFALQVSGNIYRREICVLTTKASGWQFSAQKATGDQLLGFSIPDMADKLAQQAPAIWRLLETLLSADPTLESRRARANKAGLVRPQPDADADSEDVWEEEDEYWAQLDEEESIAEVDQPGAMDVDNDNDGMSKQRRRAIARRATLIRIKRVVILNILMQSTNQRCNALACFIGLFCHSTSAPELVIEMLAHAGLSVSITGIHNVISSLSKDAHTNITKTRRNFWTL